MAIWDTILSAVKTGVIVVEDAATLTKAAIAAYHDFKSGGSATPLEALVKQAENVKPILEAVLGLLLPGEGAAIDFGIDALAFILTHSHKMTPDEENAWFDRASQASG